MPAIVGREFGMESGCEQEPLSHAYTCAIGKRCDRLGTLSHFNDGWSANEDASSRCRVDQRRIDRCLEAMELTTEMIAAHRDVEAAYQALPAFLLSQDLIGEHDHSGAGAPDRPARFAPGAKRADQT